MRSVVEETDGFEVVGEADSGEASLEAAAELAPDLVLMDVHLPGIDGLEATRRLAALPVPPVVLLLSTYDDDAGEGFVAESGAAGYVTKSAFGPDRLDERLVVRRPRVADVARSAPARRSSSSAVVAASRSALQVGSRVPVPSPTEADAARSRPGSGARWGSTVSLQRGREPGLLLVPGQHQPPPRLRQRRGAAGQLGDVGRPAPSRAAGCAGRSRSAPAGPRPGCAPPGAAGAPAASRPPPGPAARRGRARRARVARRRPVAARVRPVRRGHRCATSAAARQLQHGRHHPAPVASPRPGRRCAAGRSPPARAPGCGPGRPAPRTARPAGPKASRSASRTSTRRSGWKASATAAVASSDGQNASLTQVGQRAGPPRTTSRSSRPRRHRSRGSAGSPG